MRYKAEQGEVMEKVTEDYGVLETAPLDLQRMYNSAGRRYSSRLTTLLEQEFRKERDEYFQDTRRRRVPLTGCDPNQLETPVVVEEPLHEPQTTGATGAHLDIPLTALVSEMLTVLTPAAHSGLCPGGRSCAQWIVPRAGLEGHGHHAEPPLCEAGKCCPHHVFALY